MSNGFTNCSSRSPRNKAAIESNVNRAMMLADKSAIAYYRDLSEKGFFNRLVAGNVSQRIVVDSIAGNFNDYPYELRTYARQQIIRESYITERSLVTSCQLINTVRSDNNPQGFIIERFTVLENKDLGRYDR